jgi:hypothetical protein
MDGNRWQQIEALLEEASRLPVGQRASFLHTSSKGDGRWSRRFGRSWVPGRDPKGYFEEPAKRYQPAP